MASIAEQIRAIEEEILKTQKNKATEFHIGKLKAKIAKLREEQEKEAARKGGGGGGFAVKKSGNATVGLVGLPSVGKSTLLNKLTNAASAVAAYDFTTLDVIPGLLEHRGAKIQILDMPGIIKGAATGRGRGREVISVARSAELILLVVDAFNTGELDIVLRELEAAAIRVNRRKPDIAIHKTDRGGVNVFSTIPLTHVTEQYVKDICHEFRVVNADVVFRTDATPGEFVDVLAANRTYTKGLVVLTKCDLVERRPLAAAKAELEASGWPVVLSAAEQGVGIKELKEGIYDALEFIRLYLKPKGGKADLKEPLVITKGSTVGDVCDHLHRDFRRLFRYAKVWGPSAKFPGQDAGLEHVLEDEDILTIVTKRTE